MKKILFYISFIFLFLITINPSYAERFYIKDYNINIDVDEYGSFTVKEDIDVFFTQSSHGIVRTIPKKRDKVELISVNKNTETTSSSNYLDIKIGDPNKLVSGDEKYKIIYKITPKKKINEFYFDIVGNDWNTTIDKVNFKINMPKEFDSKKVYVYSGAHHVEINLRGVKYQVNGNVITGKISNKLNPNEGITVMVNLPYGYYKIDYFMMFKITISLFLILLFTYVVYNIWKAYGKDDHITPVVTFEPPSHVDILDSEILLNTKTSTKGFIAYIIELASKNYIKIDENRNSFTLTKLEEDYENISKRDKDALNIIFNKKNTITKEELEVSRSFYKKVETFLKEIDKSKIKTYDKYSIDPTLCTITSILTLCVYLITCFIGANFEIDELLTFAMPVAIPLVILILINLNFNANSNKISAIFSHGFIILILFFLATSVASDMYSPFLFQFLFGLICTLVCIVCLCQLPKRNSYGNKILGELFGLKHFIKTAEKHRLEKMIKDNPSYFYNILPYAYLLGVSDIWIKQFEDILRNYPEYKGSDITYHSFNRFANGMKNCSIPTEANGGISHSSSSMGGGFSGGGHGGGGGHSW